MSSDAIALGAVAGGEVARTRVDVRNSGDSAVEVAWTEVSCPCLDVSPARFRLAPGQSVALDVLFDPREDPAFRGELGVEVTGRTAGGEVAYTARVAVSVVGPPPADGEEDSDE